MANISQDEMNLRKITESVVTDNKTQFHMKLRFFCKNVMHELNSVLIYFSEQDQW